MLSFLLAASLMMPWHGVTDFDVSVAKPAQITPRFGTCPIPPPPPGMVLIQCKYYVIQKQTWCSWVGVLPMGPKGEDVLCGAHMMMPDHCGPRKFSKLMCQLPEEPKKEQKPEEPEKKGIEL